MRTVSLNHTRVFEFIRHLNYEDLPDIVKQRAKICLLDTLGTFIAAKPSELSQSIYRFVKKFHSGQDSKLWLDGACVSTIGAITAHAMTVDALDCHDGFSHAKGHVGAGVIPVLCTVPNLTETPCNGKEFLTALVIAYEIASRAGVTLHATTKDYHTSGAWNCLGAVAGASRLLQLSDDILYEALGISEFYGPRSPMMRCIQSPTMLKDGSGWGAMVAISSVLMALEGFTGSPAEIIDHDDKFFGSQDLRENWLILDQYFKPQAVCRWAQPAVQAGLELKAKYGFTPKEIDAIEVSTFTEAKCLHVSRPKTTEEAQYSLPFALAAALSADRLFLEELNDEALQNPEILRISESIRVDVNSEFDRKFPAERFAIVKILLKDGRSFQSEPTCPKWEAFDPPDFEAIVRKFDFLPSKIFQPLAEACLKADRLEDIRSLIRLLEFCES